jgi:hypothetical protein
MGLCNKLASSLLSVFVVIILLKIGCVTYFVSLAGMLIFCIKGVCQNRKMWLNCSTLIFYGEDFFILNPFSEDQPTYPQFHFGHQYGPMFMKLWGQHTIGGQLTDNKLITANLWFWNTTSRFLCKLSEVLYGEGSYNKYTTFTGLSPSRKFKK